MLDYRYSYGGEREELLAIVAGITSQLISSYIFMVFTLFDILGSSPYFILYGGVIGPVIYLLYRRVPGEIGVAVSFAISPYVSSFVVPLIPVGDEIFMSAIISFLPLAVGVILSFAYLAIAHTVEAFRYGAPKTILLPMALIVVAEVLNFRGEILYGLYLHVLNLLLLIILVYAVRSPSDSVLIALSLVSVFRVVNTAMPVFFPYTLYWFPLIYAPYLISIAYAARQIGMGWRDLGLKISRAMPLYLVVGIFLGILLGWMENQTLGATALIPILDWKNIIILSLVMFVFVGLGEELGYRGVLQTTLERELGGWGGVLISSVLFGIMHSGYGLFSEVVFATVAGFLLGIVFYFTRNMYSVVVAHAVNNILMFGIVPYLSLPYF
jgi:hypothetical protein